MGTAAGLRMSPGALLTATAFLVPLVSGIRLVTASGRRRRQPSLSWICLTTGFLLAAWNGGSAGRHSRQACSRSLVTGDRIEASGIVTNRIGGGANARRILRLADVEIVTPDGLCRMQAVMARLAGRTAVPALGAGVRIHGEWIRRNETAVWPRRPERQGLVTGAIVDQESGVVGSPAVRSRSALATRLTLRLPADVAPTGLALVLAERDELDPGLRRRFAAAGLAHLLAISGMHVGLLAAGMVWSLGYFVGPRCRIITLILVWGYVVMIGAPVAAVRALLVFAGFVWARNRGWPARAGDLLGGAAIGTLLLDPLSLVDPGFQLSFAGFGGVLLGARLSALAIPETQGAQWAERARSAARGGLISTCALLATSPFTAWHFGQLTPVAVLSHLVGVPLVAVTLATLFATLALPGPLAEIAAAVATGSIRLLHVAAGWLAVVPFGHSAVVAPGAVMWVSWTLLMFGMYRVAAAGVIRAGIGPGLLAAGVLAAAPLHRALTADHSLLCTLSVGQGDAAVLRTRRGHWMVFDGGPAGHGWDAGRSILIPFLRRHGAARVDVAVLSHPDTDHLGGLASLLEDMDVDRIIDTGDAVPSIAYERFLAAVDESGARWLAAAPGDHVRMDNVAITILGPRQAPGQAASPANATSVSFRLSIDGGFRYLNTGDATIREELDLLSVWSTDSLRADLMKVGHHGSRTSSAVAFARAVNPSLAVVSSGLRNPYGHPHSEALARLDSAGVPRIWRTDRQGTLCLEVDARGQWRVRGERTWRHAGGAP